MKKLKVILSAITVALCIPSTVFASEVVMYGAGEWDSVGYVESINLATNTFNVSQTVSSGGGNFKMRVTNVNAGNTYRVWLYEKDSGSYTPVHTSARVGYDDDEITWDVSSFVDGSDGKAELFVHIGYANTAENVTIQFFD